MERCPCCNARLRGAALCARCRADLGKTITAEQAAETWLNKAIHYWTKNEPEQSLDALAHSLQLKNTPLALTLLDFFIDQQCRQILDLLSEKKTRVAKRRLFRIRYLFPDNEMLNRLNAFTDFLLIKE